MHLHTELLLDVTVFREVLYFYSKGPYEWLKMLNFRPLLK